MRTSAPSTPEMDLGTLASWSAPVLWRFGFRLFPAQQRHQSHSARGLAHSRTCRPAGNSKNSDVPHSRRVLRPVHRGAFTLIELILVMALLVVVLGVAFPSLKGFFRGRSLDSEARRFLSLTRYGQSRAVSEGVPMVLWIDAEQGSYGLQTAAGYTDLDSKAVEFELDKDLQVEVTAPAATLLSSQWKQNTQLAAVGNTPRTLGNVPMIRFSPDGFVSETSPASVLFHQGEKDTLWIVQSTNRLGYEIPSAQPANLRR